ncbi:CAP22 protein [Stagonosporopsis vannaccii]|nr:CAP22 protein [Stagonosporopsis vannaccii]
MLFQKFAIVAALTALVAAQEIEQSDIPQQCTQVCAEVVSIARDCDNRFDDNAEIQCICNAANANTLLPSCDACVQQYDTDSDLDNDDDDDDINDPNDNDVREVLRRCNFPIQSNAASASGGVVAAGAPTASATTSINAANRNTATSTSGANAASSVAAAVSQATQNAAPAMTAAAGMGLGALGLALGML